MLYTTNSPTETFEFGRRVAKALQSGDVIGLQGDLGAGKTLFTQGIAAGLGVKDRVTSPTFMVFNLYDAKPPVYHFDLYRLSRAEELEDIGFDEYIYGRGISIVEWSDKFPGILPKAALIIQITRGQRDEQRIIHLAGQGVLYDRLAKELTHNADPGT